MHPPGGKRSIPVSFNRSCYRRVPDTLRIHSAHPAHSDFTQTISLEERKFDGLGRPKEHILFDRSSHRVYNARRFPAQTCEAKPRNVRDPVSHPPGEPDPHSRIAVHRQDDHFVDRAVRFSALFVRLNSPSRISATSIYPANAGLRRLCENSFPVDALTLLKSVLEKLAKILKDVEL